MRWLPFRRRAPDSGAELARQASALADLANAVSASLASLREREQAVEARAAWVEQSFARDAQALDERRDALRALGEELQARQDALAERERRAEELAGRETEQHAREARLLAEELTARRRSEELDARELALAAAEARARNGEGPDEADDGLDRCLLFVPTPGGWALVPLETAPPRRGATIELEGRPFTVLKLARSPLPADERRCAYLA